MPPTSAVFIPIKYVRAFPSPVVDQSFVAPTYLCERSGEILLAPKAFMVALAEGFFPDSLLASERTRHLINSKSKGGGAIAMGFKIYSAKSLEAYHTSLMHFLAWSEMRGFEVSDFDRFSYVNINHYRGPQDDTGGSLEDYMSDMMDKRRPDVRSSNPNAIRTRIMVANAFLLFCVSQGFRTRPFSPYMAKVTNAYLDRDELKARVENNTKVPEIEALADFVKSQTSLRDRVAAGLMLFGGLRVEDMLSMRLSDVPSRLEIERVGAYRIELRVFGKGHKWRTTSIPEWVYNDLRTFASSERKILRKTLLDRNLKIPMGKSAPVFVSVNDGPNFGKQLTSRFVRNIFEGSALGHPHRARHAFACWRMIELIGMRSQLMQQHPITALSEASAHGDVKDMLALEMGHVNIETTEIYLKWARRRAVDRDALPDLLLRIQNVHNGV